MSERLLAVLMRALHGQGFDGDSDDSDGSPDDQDAPTPSDQTQAERLQQSDLATSIRMQTGDVPYARVGRCVNRNVHSMIQRRRINRTRRGQFTAGERAGIMQRYIPNCREVVDEFDSHVFCGTFSQDGDMFMSACQDCQIRLYDTSNGQFKLKRTVPARDVGWAIVDTAYSPDKRFLIYSSWSHYIHLVTLDGDRHEALDLRPDSYHLCPFSIAFSHDSREIIAGTNLDSVYIYDVFDDRRTMKIQAHDDDVNAVAFADQQLNIFFSGSDDSLCKVWDRRALRESNPRPVGCLLGHAHGITYIDSRQDGRYLLTQSKDHSIKLWDIRKMGASDTQPPHQSHIDYRYPHRTRVSTRPVAGDCSVMTYRGHWVMQTLIRARFSPLATTGQKYIYSGSAPMSAGGRRGRVKGSVFVYDVLTGDVVAKLDGHDETVRDVSWHPHDPYLVLVSSSWDGSVVKWSLSDSEDADVSPMCTAEERLSRDSDEAEEEEEEEDDDDDDEDDQDDEYEL